MKLYFDPWNPFTLRARWPPTEQSVDGACTVLNGPKYNFGKSLFKTKVFIFQICHLSYVDQWPKLLSMGQNKNISGWVPLYPCFTVYNFWSYSSCIFPTRLGLQQPLSPLDLLVDCWGWNRKQFFTNTHTVKVSLAHISLIFLTEDLARIIMLGWTTLYN